jgi:carboxyl-terminal processing protease
MRHVYQFDMPSFRAAILAILCLASAANAQSDQVLSLPQGKASFVIKPGSTFSASVERKIETPTDITAPAIKAISSDMDELLRVVKNNHVSGGSVRTQALIGSAINSMLEQLDPHSNYYDPDAYRELIDDQQGRYSGIGTTISSYSRNGVLDTFVLGVSKNTPAERVGLRFGDRVVEVDGQAVSGIDSLEVRNRIRGPLGSTARLTIEKADGSIVRNIQVRREQLSQKSVTNSLLLDGNVGYLALTEGFGYTTLAEFNSAFLSLKQRGIQSLVLDLRGNGGGLMDQAIRIAERFLPAGRTIVSQRGRHPAEDRLWKSTNAHPENLPLVLLVDEGTASASEIIAGAMQDNDRATIIGERTYGKGLVQDIIPLEDGSMLTLTSERYYTPSGRSIQREYSDSGLYDYFRHTNKSDLIDRSAIATRTRNGRVVYGGDGIQPDVVVKGFEMTPNRSELTDRLFFYLRSDRAALRGEDFLQSFCDQQEIAAKCTQDLPFLRSQLAQFESYKAASDESMPFTVLKADPQIKSALKFLAEKKP